MSPIIQWLLARSQMQKAAIGGMDSAYRYRGPAVGSPAQLKQQVALNKEMAPINAGAAAVGAFANPVNNLKNMMALPGQYAKGVQAAGTAMGDAAGTAWGALDNHVSGSGWKPQGSTPSMPAPSSPEAGRTPASAGADLFGQLLPTPTAPYAAGGMGGVASTGAGVMKPQTPAGKTVQVNYGTNPPAAKPQTPVNAQMASRQSAQPAQPSAMHPSEQAKVLRAQINKRQTDAAFGRGTFSPQERQKMMAQHEALIAQSNKMRNAAGYQPDAASTNPRDVADRARIQLNKQRSTAGGEVSQAPQVMQRLNQLGRQYDAAPAQTQAQPPMGAPAAELQNMVAKTSSASMPFRFGAYIGQLSR